MRNGICPLCGAAAIYGSERGLLAHTSSLALRSHEIRVTDPALMVFVCAECGHVALQVQPMDLDDLRALVQGVKWTYMEPGSWDRQSEASNGFHPAPERPPISSTPAIIGLIGLCLFLLLIGYLVLR
jgi:hypothetical protein